MQQMLRSVFPTVVKLQLQSVLHRSAIYGLNSPLSTSPSHIRSGVVGEHGVSTRKSAKGKRPNTFLRVISDDTSVTYAREKTLIELLQEIDDPNTAELTKSLDLSLPLGISPRTENKASLYGFFEHMKRSHPNRIVLVRVRGCYEAVGIDAVLLMQYAGLQRVGQTVPQIRISKLNLQHILHKVVDECGFEVVICEEKATGYKVGNRLQEPRYDVAGIVGGANPSYYFDKNDADQNLTADQDKLEYSPLAAVSWSQTGYCLILYYVEKKVLKVVSRMSEEGLWAKLSSTGIKMPLYLHKSSVPGAKVDSTFYRWEQKIKQIASRQLGDIFTYNSLEPESGFLQILKSKNAEIDLENVSRMSEDVTEKTSPPPLSTVREIGVSPRKGSGVLHLMDSLLPPKTAKTIVGWMRQCILDPPPPEIAKHIQRVLMELESVPCSIPKSLLHLSPTKLVQVLESTRLSVESLNDIRTILRGVVDFLEEPDVSSWVDSLLKIVAHETNIEIPTREFITTCQQAVEEICMVINEDVDHIKSTFPDQPSNNSTAVKRTVVDENFFSHLYDSFYHCINQQLVMKESKFLDKARSRALAAVTDLVSEMRMLGIYNRSECNLEYYTIRVVVKKGYRLPLSVISPDHSKPHYVTNQELEKASSELSFAIYQWHTKVEEEIEKLGMRLREKLSCLITASHACIVLVALSNHVVEAQTRQWCRPDISRLLRKEPGELKIKDFWPYWMDKENSSLNSVSLKGMMVLTGPNMAGKSTILRSIASVCCLASAGFYVPAESADIPFIDCVNLKTLVTDSPLENLSAFGVEMNEMKHVLNDATNHTLLLIDELGKGTEVIAGTALSAAILKEICDRGCIGVFATHLHSIKDFAKDFNGVEYQRMNVYKDQDGEKIATWEMVPGFCEESFGLNVALEQGIPADIVDRAHQLMSSLDEIQT